MAERAQAEEALRQAQKMEAVGQLAGGIAHDFNNLLTIIRGYVEFLTLEMRPGPQVSEALREIDTAAERAAKLTSQLLMFSRKKPMQRKIFDLNEAITALGTMLRPVLGENIDLDIQTSANPLTLHADPLMIEMVILNLAMNARDAMPQGGQLLIRADEIEIKAGDCRRHPRASPGQFACILVRDNGVGIAPEVLPHLFEPFFTTKDVGKGTGLGLASAYGIVTQHAGWIEVESTPGCGAAFKVFLPASAIQAGPAIPKTTKTQVPGGKETILLVEDEQSLRRLTRTVLQRQGYLVHEAASGTEALALWNEHGPEIRLLLTDMIMPGGMFRTGSGGTASDEKKRPQGHLHFRLQPGRDQPEPAVERRRQFFGEALSSGQIAVHHPTVPGRRRSRLGPNRNSAGLAFKRAACFSWCHSDRQWPNPNPHRYLNPPKTTIAIKNRIKIGTATSDSPACLERGHNLFSGQ